MYSNLTVYLYHIFDMSLNGLFFFLFSFVGSSGISINHSCKLPSEGVFLHWEVVQLLTTQMWSKDWQHWHHLVASQDYSMLGPS